MKPEKDEESDSKELLFINLNLFSAALLLFASAPKSQISQENEVQYSIPKFLDLLFSVSQMVGDMYFPKGEIASDCFDFDFLGKRHAFTFQTEGFQKGPSEDPHAALGVF